MGRTFRKQRRKSSEDDWGGSKPKDKKGHKAERARIRKALRNGEDPIDIE